MEGAIGTIGELFEKSSPITPQKPLKNGEFEVFGVGEDGIRIFLLSGGDRKRYDGTLFFYVNTFFKKICYNNKTFLFLVVFGDITVVYR